MGSGVVIYVPSFIKIGSGIQKLIGEDTQTQHGDLISLLIFFFFQNTESRLKKGPLKGHSFLPLSPIASLRAITSPIHPTTERRPLKGLYSLLFSLLLRLAKICRPHTCHYTIPDGNHPCCDNPKSTFLLSFPRKCLWCSGCWGWTYIVSTIGEMMQFLLHSFTSLFRTHDSIIH
jgi:hypothetical protein